MTQVIEKTEKQVKFDQWLEALRSGDYIQAEGALHACDNGTDTYCCIGILDEVVYGTEWFPPPAGYGGGDDEDDYTYFEYVDDAGESTLMDPERVSDLGLDKELNAVERKYFEKIGVEIAGEVDRISVLATANDMGHTFESIADYMEELGWNT